MKKYNRDLILKKPEAVLFDTDNTLYEYEPANRAAIRNVCNKAIKLLNISEDIFFSTYKQARQDIKCNLDKTASGHSRLLYFQRMIEILGFKAQLLLALDLEQTFWRTFLANAPLFDGVRETLELLQELRIPIGVVTDLTSHIQLRKLTYFGLEDTFDAVVTSEEIGKDKPDERNFILLLNKLNKGQDALFWMIGDNPISDISGAKNLGGITFQKIHKNVQLGKNEYKPDFSFNNYSELFNLIKKL